MPGELWELAIRELRDPVRHLRHIHFLDHCRRIFMSRYQSQIRTSSKDQTLANANDSLPFKSFTELVSDCLLP